MLAAVRFRNEMCELRKAPVEGMLAIMAAPEEYEEGDTTETDEEQQKCVQDLD